MPPKGKDNRRGQIVCSIVTGLAELDHDLYRSEAIAGWWRRVTSVLYGRRRCRGRALGLQ